MRTTVGLSEYSKLHILAPDEGKAPDGVPAWQILIDRTIDEELTTEGTHILEGMNFAALEIWLRKVLPNHIPISVVDKKWSKINSALKNLSREYGRQRLAEIGYKEPTHS